MLEEANMKISMSRTGNPYDNAHMESFFKTLKYEEVHLSNYETYDDALEQLPHFIEEVYNKKRLHSALGYLPPEEYEMTIQQPKNTDRAPPQIPVNSLLLEGGAVQSVKRIREKLKEAFHTGRGRKPERFIEPELRSYAAGEITSS